MEMLSRGVVEVLTVFLNVIFLVAAIVGVVKLCQRPASERTIATLVEENRRLREEIAALKGENTYVEPEV